MPEKKKESGQGDRFFVQKDKHHVFQRLSQGEDAPFKQLKELWILAAAVGFKAGLRKPLQGGTQHVGFWHYLSTQEDIPLLHAIAIAETSDVSVLGDQSKVIRIAEEYANGGIDLLEDSERSERAGTLQALASMVVQESQRKHANK